MGRIILDPSFYYLQMRCEVLQLSLHPPRLGWLRGSARDSGGRSANQLTTSLASEPVRLTGELSELRHKQVAERADDDDSGGEGGECDSDCLVGRERLWIGVLRVQDVANGNLLLLSWNLLRRHCD